jgi:hypothetical protein
MWKALIIARILTREHAPIVNLRCPGEGCCERAVWLKKISVPELKFVVIASLDKYGTCGDTHTHQTMEHLTSAPFCNAGKVVNRQELHSALWIGELVVGLFPGAIMLFGGLIPFLFLLPIFPQVIIDRPDAATVRTFVAISIRVIGGILGFTAIFMSFNPVSLRSNPKRKWIAVLFGCFGILAEVVYVTQEGLNATISNPYVLWALLGPLLVGMHCFYRVFRVQETHDNPVPCETPSRSQDRWQ